jgi:transcriptional regulator with GAF, ATPase, and Fis domain
VAPLRSRKEDIPLLAEHFLVPISRKTNRPTPRLTRTNLLELGDYSWPGNVRELQNVIERAVITSHRGALEFDLPREPATDNAIKSVAFTDQTDTPIKVIPELEMKRRERRNVLTALEISGWKIYGADGAAERLGIKPTTLASRIKKMGIKKPI